jgi:hypothetical protein
MIIKPPKLIQGFLTFIINELYFNRIGFLCNPVCLFEILLENVPISFAGSPWHVKTNAVTLYLEVFVMYSYYCFIVKTLYR